MNDKKRKEYKLKQFIIEIPLEIHTQIKMAAAQRNISMRTWALRQLLNALKLEV